MGSALDSASLIMYPSGYSDGVLGSAKPTDGSGDFTFTRGSNLSATRVGPNGYIEKGYENLLLQSNSFLTSPWVAIGTSVTGGQAGYDGSNDAWLLEASSTGSSRYAFQNISTSGVNTFSLYAKAGTSDYIRIQINASSTSFAYFDISAGTAGTTLNDIDTDIEDVGSGWYRCSLTMNNSSITAVRIYVAALNSVSVTAGDNVYIQDAMLNQGLVAYPYIETTTAPVAGGILEDEPRIDFSDGCGHLLLEPSRTNLIAHSEYFSDSYYIKDSGISTIENQLLSPEGFLNACKVSVSNNNRIYANNTSGTYILSFFIKAGTFSHFRIFGQNIDLTTSPISVGILDFEDYGNGWYRIYYSYTGNRGFQIQAYPDNTYSAHTTSGDYYIYGHQLEQDATYPTSYIPTYGVSQTRLKDNVSSLAGLDALNSAATIVAEFKVNSTGSVYYFQSTGASSYVNINQYTAERLRVIVRFEGVSVINVVLSNKIYPNTNYKWALRYDTNKVDVFLNGESIISRTGTWTLEPLDNLTWNFTEGNETKQVLVFPTALSDSECIALTTI